MDGIEEINYTILEPINTYWSDVFSPGQTKQQLEIGLEVKPTKKPKEGVETLNDGEKLRFEKTIRTRSRNIKLDVIVTREHDGAISKGSIRNKISSQKCTTETGVEVEGKIFSFDNDSYGEVVMLKPGQFTIEIKRTTYKDSNNNTKYEKFNLSFIAYNDDFN